MPTFGCGHPREPENITLVNRRYPACRICHVQRQRKSREAMTPAERYTEHRMRYIPRQIEATELKLAHLKAEAQRYGMAVE